MSDGKYKPYLMADVLRAAAARRFTVVSTFAGAGGSSIGYSLAGGRVALANEFLPQAARSYRANFPDTLVDERDIRAIVATPAATEAFLAQAGLKPGELDILDGSPPCDEYSRLGHGLREGGTAARVFDFFRLPRTARPKIVIAENVPALASDYPMPFENALELLRFSGGSRDRQYYVNTSVLSAEDFGVPQARERLLFIGVRKDVAEAVGINSDAGVLALFPAPTTRVPVNVRPALAGLQQSEREEYLWRRALMTSALARFAPLLVRDPEKWPEPKWIKLCHVGFGSDSRYTLVRSDWDLPAPTLTASGQQPDGRCGVLHPAEHRKFSIPELKRLFGLPDDYAFTGTLAQAAERLGNMVPPFVTRAVAASVYELVLRPYAERRR